MTVSNDLIGTSHVCYVNLAVRLFGLNTNNGLALYTGRFIMFSMITNI